MNHTTNTNHLAHTPWNKGKLIGQKLPLKLKEIWAIRIRLQLDKRTRELALFNLAIDSKLRGCDLVGLKVSDVYQGGRVSSRAIVMQQKTRRPVQFEITEQTRESIMAWINQAKLRSDQYLFPSRIHGSIHLSTRQYARIIEGWVKSIGLDPAAYGTHTMRPELTPLALPSVFGLALPHRLPLHVGRIVRTPTGQGGDVVDDIAGAGAAGVTVGRVRMTVFEAV